MALTDIPVPQQTEAQRAAALVRQIVKDVLNHAQSALHQVRTTVRGQRSAVATELGDDAAAMLTVYNRLKDAVEAGKAVTVDDLPA